MNLCLVFGGKSSIHAILHDVLECVEVGSIVGDCVVIVKSSDCIVILL